MVTPFPFFLLEKDRVWWYLSYVLNWRFSFFLYLRLFRGRCSGFKCPGRILSPVGGFYRNRTKSLWHWYSGMTVFFKTSTLRNSIRPIRPNGFLGYISVIRGIFRPFSQFPSLPAHYYLRLGHFPYTVTIRWRKLLSPSSTSVPYIHRKSLTFPIFYLKEDLVVRDWGAGTCLCLGTGHFPDQRVVLHSVFTHSFRIEAENSLVGM